MAVVVQLKAPQAYFRLSFSDYVDVVQVEVLVLTTVGFVLLNLSTPMVQLIYNVPPILAAGFITILPIFNTFGRVLLPSASDYIGRFHLFNIVFFVVGS